MEATKKNEVIARNIINIFAKNECTVVEAEEILLYVRDIVKEKTTVQMIREKLFDYEE